MVLTWTHMVDDTSVELPAHFLRRRESEVCDHNAKPVVKTEDVLWLQISMVYPKGMAVLDSID